MVLAANLEESDFGVSRTEEFDFAEFVFVEFASWPKLDLQTDYSFLGFTITIVKPISSSFVEFAEDLPARIEPIRVIG